MNWVRGGGSILGIALAGAEVSVCVRKLLQSCRHEKKSVSS